MNVSSTFAVAIDPTKAKQGAAEAVAAARSMGAEMKKSGVDFERAATGAGQAGKKAGDDISGGARKAEDAVERLGRSRGFDGLKRAAQSALGGLNGSLGDIAAATGALNGPLGSVIGRVDAFRRIIASFRDGLGDVGGASSSAAASIRGLEGATAGGAAGLAMMALKAAPLVAVLGAVTAAVGALSLGFMALVSGVQQAGQFETMENQLAVLLGSFDKAKDRLEEITELALKTPFAMKELTEGNRLLETFTQGALSGRNAMLLIGDAAAGAGRNFSEVAMWTGRMYASLKGGQPIGEATMRLLEMGLILPQTKSKMDKMAESANVGGKNFAQIWAMAEQSLKRFDGAMLIQSSSWQGLISSLEDSWTVFTANLGAPVRDSLKPALQAAIDFLGDQNGAGAKFGEIIAGKITAVTAMLASGNFWEGMARNMWATIAVGLIDFTGKLAAAVQTGGDILVRAFQNAVEFLAAIGTPEFWARTGAILQNVAIDFGNYLLDAGAKLVSLLTEQLPSWAGGGKTDWTANKINNVAVPDMTLPDIFEGNNGDFSAVQKFRENEAEMDALFADTQDAWTKWADDWNKLELEPVAAKLQKPFDKDAMKLPDPAATAGPESLEDDPTIKKAKAVREKRAKDQRSEFQRLLDDWRNLAVQIDQVNAGIANSMSNHISGALTSWINGSKSAKEAFNDMAMGIVNDIVAMTIKMLVQYALAQALGWVTGAPVASVGVAHGGGNVMDTGATRSVGTDTFSGASRFAHGGTVQGVGSGETPIIAEPGEKVLTKAQANDIKGKLAGAGNGAPATGEARGTTIINVRDPEEVRAYLARHPEAVVNIIADQATTIKKILGTDRR